MGKTEISIAGRGYDLAVAGILGPALDEIRWRHPKVRVSCGALVGPAIRVLASRQPSAIPSLAGHQLPGAAATEFIALLETAPEIVVADVTEDGRFTRLSDALLDEDTRATAIVPLHIDGVVVGYLRADAAQAGPIAPELVEQLHQSAALASATIMLERERTRCFASESRVQQLTASISHQSARHRDAGLMLQQAVVLLHDMVERVAPRVAPTERAELGSLARRCAQHIDAALDTLTETSTRASQHAAS